MSVIQSIAHGVTRGAGRVARELPDAIGRARREGERTVRERRQRDALIALGSRALALSRDNALTAEALAPELAVVEARTAEVEALGHDTAPPEAAHDTAVAFPMLTDDPAQAD
jgi:hypothetical protein